MTEPEDPPPPAPEGSFSFTYTGDVSGSFDVVGAYSEPISGSFAHARPTVQGDRLSLHVLRSRDNGVYDSVYLVITLPVDPGTFPLEAPSTLGYGMVELGQSPEYAFRLRSGEIVVTELSAGRIRGEFVAAGEDYVPLEQLTYRVEIFSGVFDLPILPRP